MFSGVAGEGWRVGHDQLQLPGDCRVRVTQPHHLLLLLQFYFVTSCRFCPRATTCSCVVCLDRHVDGSLSVCCVWTRTLTARSVCCVWTGTLTARSVCSVLCLDRHVDGSLSVLCLDTRVDGSLSVCCVWTRTLTARSVCVVFGQAR